MVDIAREVCDSMRMMGEGRNPKAVQRNDVVKAAVEIKEAEENHELRARDEAAKKKKKESRYKEVYNEEKRKFERYIYIRAKRR